MAGGTAAATGSIRRRPIVTAPHAPSPMAARVTAAGAGPASSAMAAAMAMPAPALHGAERRMNSVSRLSTSCTIRAEASPDARASA